MKPTRKAGQRIGWAGYVTVLAAIKREPMTTLQVVDEIGVHPVTMLHIMRRLKAVNLAHISAWRNRGRGGMEAVWAYGDGVEAPYPGKQRKPLPARSNNMASSVIALASVIRLLVEPISKGDIMEAAGIRHESLGALLNHMHSLNLCRIGDWAPRIKGGAPAALWVLGDGPHQPRPARKSRTLIHRERWAAKKQRAAMQRMIHATAANQPCIAEAA